MEASAEGIRAVWISLAVLGGTAALQAAVVAVSGSVALLGDTLHNAADALTAVPLGIAFVAGRRPANRRYTYGYGRAEDLAGVVIVVFIAASSAVAVSVAVTRLAHPRPGDRPAGGRGGGGHRVHRQRGGRPVPDRCRAQDRLGGAGRRRAACPRRWVRVADGPARRRRGGHRLGLGPTRSPTC
jgi:cation efflux family protein